MFLQTGLGVLVGFSNRFRIFNFWFCKPSLCGLEIGTKLEWNLHKKILFYQKTSRLHQKNLELVKKKQVEHTKKIWSLSKKQVEPTKKIWSLSKNQVGAAKQSGAGQKNKSSPRKKIEFIVKNKSKPSNMMELVKKKNKSSPPKHIKLQTKQVEPAKKYGALSNKNKSCMAKTRELAIYIYI